jgi:hypothetical protein
VTASPTTTSETLPAVATPTNVGVVLPNAGSRPERGSQDTALGLVVLVVAAMGLGLAGVTAGMRRRG